MKTTVSWLSLRKATRRKFLLLLLIQWITPLYLWKLRSSQLWRMFWKYQRRTTPLIWSLELLWSGMRTGSFTITWNRRRHWMYYQMQRQYLCCYFIHKDFIFVILRWTSCGYHTSFLRTQTMMRLWQWMVTLELSCLSLDKEGLPEVDLRLLMRSNVL